MNLLGSVLDLISVVLALFLMNWLIRRFMPRSFWDKFSRSRKVSEQDNVEQSSPNDWKKTRRNMIAAVSTVLFLALVLIGNYFNKSLSKLILNQEDCTMYGIASARVVNGTAYLRDGGVVMATLEKLDRNRVVATMRDGTSKVLEIERGEPSKTQWTKVPNGWVRKYANDKERKADPDLLADAVFLTDPNDYSHGWVAATIPMPGSDGVVFLQCTL